MQFPVGSVHVCLFHYAQTIGRKTQDVGLAVDYRATVEIRTFIRRLAAPSFVPLGRLDEAWVQIAADAPDNPRAGALSDYFVRTWFDDTRLVFSMSTWKHCAHMNVESARTNKSVEGFHLALNKKCDTAHPDIHRLVQMLRGEQEKTEGLLCLRQVGQPLPQRGRKVVASGRRLENLEAELEANQRTFLSSIGACSLAEQTGLIVY